jgi:hypothetical protein
MFDIIAEVLIRFILMYPGAFIRWMFGGFKKEYKYYLDISETELNSSIGIVFGVVILVIVLLCKK